MTTWQASDGRPLSAFIRRMDARTGVAGDNIRRQQRRADAESDGAVIALEGEQVKSDDYRLILIEWIEEGRVVVSLDDVSLSGFELAMLSDADFDRAMIAVTSRR